MTFSALSLPLKLPLPIYSSCYRHWTWAYYFFKKVIRGMLLMSRWILLIRSLQKTYLYDVSSRRWMKWGYTHCILMTRKQRFSLANAQGLLLLRDSEVFTFVQSRDGSNAIVTGPESIFDKNKSGWRRTLGKMGSPSAALTEVEEILTLYFVDLNVSQSIVVSHSIHTFHPSEICIPVASAMTRKEM